MLENTSDSIYNKELNMVNNCSNILDSELLFKNYGVSYNTTGGGIEQDLDLFIQKRKVKKETLLKYLKLVNIKKLTKESLVPLAILYGDKAMNKTIKFIELSDEKNKSIPIITLDQYERYKKQANISALSISINTIIPLEFAKLIYDTYKSKKKQTGGDLSRLFIGRNVPPGNLQLMHSFWNGQTIPNNIYSPLNNYGQNNRSFSFMNPELQPSSTIPSLPSDNSISQVEVPSIVGEEANQVNAMSSGPSPVSESGSNSDSILVLPNSMA